MRSFRAAVCVVAMASVAYSAETDASKLRQEVEAADRALFSAVFDSCNADAVGAMITDDFEFFHDKWGQIAKSKEDFVKLIRGSCERQRQGTDFKAKRQLIQASSTVSPMRDFGALHTGSHAFFKIEANGQLIPTEHGKFIHLWRLVSGRWLLARAISYDHVNDPTPSAGR